MKTRSDARHAGRAPAVALAFVLSAAGLAVVAQTPAPTTQPPGGQTAQPPPATPPGSAQGAPAQGDAAGRGRGGGRQDLSGIDFTKQPPILPKTPEEQLKLFILPPGYRLELVLADPIIQEPTAIAFDGNGRMFVVEDRSYMLDIDMTGQLDPISRISLHVDTDNDGVYDKHTVFVDNLVFPRFVTPFGPNAILTKESNAQEVWKYTDTNGDGVADKKELFDTGYGRLANIEGQEAFLTWTLDNWMYSTYNAFRARWTPHGVIKEPTGNNGGEWGVTQDNDGKIWFESGAPGVPVELSVPDRLRELRRAGRARAGLPDSLGRAGSRRRHARRPERDAHARRIAQRASPGARATTSTAATGCRKISWATISTASRSGASSGGSTRRTKKASRICTTRIRTTSSSSRSIRSSVPST